MKHLKNKHVHVNLKFIWFAYDDCSFWFRLWNEYGLLIKNKSSPILFSERVGAKGQRTHHIFGYRVEVLRPDNPITWLGFFNRVFFQFLCIRLTKHQDRRIVNFVPQSYDFIMGPSPQASGSDLGIGLRGTGSFEIWTWWSFMYWVIPFTGWSEKNPFRYIGGEQQYRQLTNPIKREDEA